MDMEGRVVVVVTPQLLANAQTGMHAARILELGLTAYGKTADEAVRKVKRMCGASVRAHRAAGTLVDWLNRSGLEWSWLEKYSGRLPVENAERSAFELIIPPAQQGGSNGYHTASAMAA